MNILVVCQNYYPEQFRINDISEQLATDGHTVTVITGLPNYPTGKIPKEYRWWKKRRENINGVKIIRCFEIGRRKGAAGLALNYLSFMLSSSLRAFFIKKDFDIIFIYQLSPITMALSGMVLRKRSKKPVYLYCCDIWPDSMKIMIQNENNLLYRIMKKFSRYIYSNCDEISVTSKPFLAYFNQEHGISMQKLSYLPQHAEDMYFNMDLSDDNQTTDFVFMGNIGIAQDIDCILNAAERIKDISGFKVHFVGDGSYLEKSKQLVSQKGLEKIIIFHGRYPLEKMINFYRLADACLLTLRTGSMISLTMPSKLQGYMAAGKPVIGAIDGAASEVITESGCGICVDAGDDISLAEALKDFIRNPGKYKDCGKKGREFFIRNFTKDIFMSKLHKKLEKLVEG